MYCEICKNLETENKEGLLALSMHAYAQVISILKIYNNNSANKINKDSSCVSVCIKCLQGFNF
ncbi:MAG: hypothetical protein WC546_06790 [Candidatus Omnitrophota bacterium]